MKLPGSFSKKRGVGTWTTLRHSAALLIVFGVIVTAHAETIRGPEIPIPARFFGMTIHGITNNTPWPPFPIATLRLWDVVMWASINKADGVYDWARLDDVMKVYEEHGVTDIVFTFGGVPSWVSTNPATPCVGLGGEPIPLISIVRKGGLVTVTTVKPHRRRAGDPIGIGGVSDPSFDGGFTILTISSEKTFSFRQQGHDSAARGGTVYGYGGCKSPVRIPQAAVSFARVLAQRYCGRIRTYELWNEPDMGSEIPINLADLDRQIYSTVKDTTNCSCVGPQCAPGLKDGRNPNLVVSPAISATFPPQLRWLKQYLSSSIQPNFDVIGFHGYGYNKLPEHFPNGIQRVRLTSGFPALQVWDTEGSWGKDDSLSPEKRAGWVAKAYVMQWLSGVSRFYWYAYDNGSWGTLWTSSGGLNAAGLAYQETYKWLVGATLTACEVTDARVLCTLNRSTQNYAAYLGWSPSGNFTFTIPDGYTDYRTVDGTVHPVSKGQAITIDGNPLLVETQPVPITSPMNRTQ